MNHNVAKYVAELCTAILPASAEEIDDEEIVQKLFQEEIRKRIFEGLTKTNDTKRKASAAASAAATPVKKKKKVRKAVHPRVVRRRGDMKPEDFAWWRLIHHPDVGDKNSSTGKLFRRRFRVSFHLFEQIVKVMKPLMGIRDRNNGGVESIPFEIKVLSSLRRVGRGSCWDTIRELCQDIPCMRTLREFFRKFCRAFRERYEDEYLHIPRTETELESVLAESLRKGYPGCLGFMDGVHCRWDRCPAQWRHLFKVGSNKHPTIGWQCCVNHKRRFMSVMSAQMGTVNDQNACKRDEFVRTLCHDPMYSKAKYRLHHWPGGAYFDEEGLWLSVDGGYISIPCLLLGDADSLEEAMNAFHDFMLGQRKHVECAYGILKGRFRIFKLPLMMHDFDAIDDMFVTCCILHNMCLDDDGRDQGWHLGDVPDEDADETYDYLGDDGEFSDDEEHYYTLGNKTLKVKKKTDVSMGCFKLPAYVFGSPGDDAEHNRKRQAHADHWYYMYRNGKIQWDKKKKKKKKWRKRM